MDIDAVIKTLRNGALPVNSPVVDLNIDQMLSQYVGLSSSLDAWIAITLNQMENRLRDELSAIMMNKDHSPRHRAHTARLLLTMDPTNEPVCRFLMTTYAEMGDQSAALKIYNTLYYHLEEDYDIEPTEETANLVVAIKLGQLAVVRDDPAPAPILNETPRIPEIFVSNFEVQTDHTPAKNLTSVFRRELLANLSTFREWKLYDYEPKQPKGYRLDGVISDWQDQIVFIATLKQANDGRIIWSERFQVGFGNWRKVQWQIAQRLSVAVNQSISNDRLNRCLSYVPDNQDVFDKWVMSQSLLNEWKPDQTEQGLILLKEITQAAPRFAAAHASLAATSHVLHIVYPGVRRSAAESQRGMYHAQKAMEIDPLDSQSHRVTAWSKALMGEFDISSFHFERCWELNPNLMHTQVSCALGFAFTDRLDRACEIADQARHVTRNLHPFHWGYLQNVYFLAGRLEDAKHAGEMASDAIFNLPAWRAATLWELGKRAEAKSAGEQFLKLVKKNWFSKEPKTDDNIIDWLAHCFPLKNEAQRMRLRQGVIEALGS